MVRIDGEKEEVSEIGRKQKGEKEKWGVNVRRQGKLGKMR